MKIAAFIDNLSKGGAQGVFVTVINYLCEKNYDITVIVQNLDDAVHLTNIDKRISVHNFNVYAAKQLFPKLKDYVKENEFDLAIAFTPEIAVNLIWAKKFGKKQYAIIGRCINTLSYEYKHAATFFRRYITNTLVKIFYHKINYSIAQSAGMGKDLIQNYGFKKEQVNIINNALGTIYEKEASSPEIYEKDNYILYAGRLEPQKGLFMLLDAFAGMEDKTIGLKLIGEGAQRDELKQYAKKLNIIERVEFIPYTTDIIKYYRRAKITVMTSYFEGFPNVLSESIACGTPVVSFDLPSGPKEIIIEETNGYLVEYLNVEQMSRKMDQAVHKSWNTKEVKATARRYFRENIMKQYLALIQKALRQ